MDSGQGDTSGRRAMPILRAAAMVVVLAGLYFGKSLIIPVLVAAFLAILCYKPMDLLVRKGAPTWAALLVVLIVALLLITSFGLLIGNAIAEFANEMPKYQDQFTTLSSDVYAWAEDHGIDMVALEGDADEQSTKIVSMISALLSETLSLLSDFLLILLIMAFMLIEAAQMPKKLRRAIGNPKADLSKSQLVMDNVYGYVSVKTAVSLVTGLLFGLATWAIGLEFSVLWGLLAFALNFVPNVGSVIAMIPPAIFALITNPDDPTPAIWVVVMSLGVNQVMGNVVEPKVMGKRLGLSPLVVILSLLFWAWLWGPIGMILSVPLTMVVKIVMEGSDEWRPVAILLGPASGDDPDRAPADTPTAKPEHETPGDPA